MYLKKMTLILIIGFIASFSIRTFGTVFPQIFKDILIVRAAVLINAFFALSHFLFWFFFYREYISVKKATLRKICMLAIVGSLAVSFLYIKKLPSVFDLNVLFPLFLFNPYVDALVPLFSSTIHLIFFVAFRYSIEPDEKRALHNPILSIIIGISLFLFLHLTVLFNFITKNKFEWLGLMPRIVAVGTLPLIIIAVFLILIFYYRFYYFLDSGDKLIHGDERSL